MVWSGEIPFDILCNIVYKYWQANGDIAEDRWISLGRNPTGPTVTVVGSLRAIDQGYYPLNLTGCNLSGRIRSGALS
jgi:hypothetical protein